LFYGQGESKLARRTFLLAVLELNAMSQRYAHGGKESLSKLLPRYPDGLRLLVEPLMWQR
jgi:hypothetical protein